MTLELMLERARLVPGAEVRGTVRTPDGGRPRSVAVTLGFCERGGSFAAVAWLTRVELARGEQLAPGWSSPFALTLPPEATPGVRSAHGELWWQVEARAETHLRDAVATQRIEVMAAGAC